MSRKFVVLVAVALSVTAVAAVAANRAGSGKVTLCAAKKDDALSLGAKGKCSKGETEVTVAKRGKRGKQGPQGPAGVDGTPADIAPEAKRLVQGPAVEACQSQPGVFCDPVGGIPGWANLGSGLAPVSFQKDAAGYVHLEGTAKESGSGVYGAAIVFYLPPGYRPASGGLRLPNVAPGLSPGETVEIRTDGAVYSSDSFVTLDGISFRP